MPLAGDIPQEKLLANWHGQKATVPQTVLSPCSLIPANFGGLVDDVVRLHSKRSREHVKMYHDFNIMDYANKRVTSHILVEAAGSPLSIADQNANRIKSKMNVLYT